MRIPRNGFLIATAYVGLLMLLVAALNTGCSAESPTDPDGETTMMIDGTWPNWDVEDMVKQSDAIVVGAISRELGSKQEPGFGDTTRFYYDYKDYELTIQEVLHSSTDLPEQIAILAEVGVSTDEGSAILGLERIPSFQPDERILVFLRSLEGPKFSEGVGRPVPNGFKEETYFQVIVGGKFGKLLPEDGKWKDASTQQAFSPDLLKNAIDIHNAD